MTGCCAVGCSNSSSKGYLMKRFPSDPERRKVWEAKVNRPNWKPTDRSCLCDVHFTPDCFEQNRVDGRRLLKWKAIPTIFSHIPSKIVKKTRKRISTSQMTGCCVVGCSNSSSKGFIMKRFPSDPERRKLWEAEMNRPDWKPKSTSYLCEVHFTPDCFEQDKANGKNKLKLTAIPTIFSHLSPQNHGKPQKRIKTELVPTVQEPSTYQATQLVFQCTWPGCHIWATSCESIKAHIRNSHFRRRSKGGNEGLAVNDYEEEFFYTEVDIGHTSQLPPLSHSIFGTPFS